MLNQRVRRLVGICGTLVAILLITAAVVVQLGRMLAPLISDNRQVLADYLSQQTGAVVDIGYIDAEWEGLRPQLNIEQLVIKNPSGDTVFSLQQVVAQLDIMQSLLDRGLRMWQLEINQARGHFAQSPDGRWGFAGLPLPESSSTRFDPLEMLLLGRFVRFDDVEFDFDFAHGRQQQLSFTEMLLQNQDDFHRLSADLDLPSQENAVTLVFEGEGDPREQDFSGNGYLKGFNYPLSQAAAFISETLENHSGVNDGLLSGEVWMSQRPHQPLKLEGQFKVQRPTSVNDELPQSFSSQLTGEWLPGGHWALRLQDAQAVWQQKSWPAMNMLISADAEANNLLVQVPQISARWLSHLNVVPQISDKIKSIISELDASGELRNLRLLVPLENPRAFQLQANLHQVSVKPWKAAPGVKNLNGYVQASAYAGAVQIDNAGSLELDFPRLYRQPFVFDRGQGEVYWDIDPDNNQVRVKSSHLAISSSLGEATGYFYLDTPIQRNTRPLEIMLQIGLRNGKAADHNKLVPEVLPEALLAWLDQAIVGGRVASGGFLLHGYFGHEASPTRSIQTALNVDQAELRFDPRWPALHDVSGHLQIDTTEVYGWLDQGQLAQGRLGSTYLEVSKNSLGEGLLLGINGTLQGSAQTGLDLLTQTPLHEVIGSGLDQWRLQGELDAQVQLQIPLQAQQPGSRQQVAVSLRNAELLMQDIDLQFDGIEGQLTYSDEDGLNSDQLTASLWQQPLKVDIGAGAGGKHTDVKFNGSLDMAALARWSRRPEVLFAQGTIPVVGSVTVGGGDVPVRLRAHSTLKGARIDLPEPYGKDAQQERDLRIEIPIARQSVGYQIQYDELVSVDLMAVPQQPIAGSIALGQPAKRRQQPGIWLEGEAGQADVMLWQPVLQRYQDYSRQLAELPARQDPLAELPESGVINQPLVPAETASTSPNLSGQLNLDLLVQRLLWHDIELKQVHLGGGQLQQGWRIELNDDQIKGRLQISGDDRPLDIDLDYVRWPEMAASESSGLEAQLQAFDPSSIVPLDVSISELKVGQRDYGHWTFLAQPTQDGMRVSGIQGRIDGIDISATDRYPSPLNGASSAAHVAGSEAAGASLIWNKVPALDEGDSGLQTTRFQGRLTSTNLKQFSDSWHLPRTLDSRKMVVDADLSWNGSPMAFALTELRGRLALDARDGRFFRTTGQASSAFLRLVGLFNFDSWIRRLQLDFSDVLQSGTPFERVAGELKFDRGLIHLIDPVKVTNTSSVLQMGGSINLQQETLDTSLVATLPVGGNATVIAALAGGLPAAAGVYAISKIFKKQVERMASVSYRIRGPWADPDIKFDRLFDNKAAKEASKDSQKEGDKTN